MSEQQLLVTAVAALAGAVTVLFRIVRTTTKEQVDVSKRLGYLEGNHEAVESMNKKTLKAVHAAVAERPEPQLCKAPICNYPEIIQ